MRFQARRFKAPPWCLGKRLGFPAFRSKVAKAPPIFPPRAAKRFAQLACWRLTTTTASRFGSHVYRLKRRTLKNLAQGTGELIRGARTGLTRDRERLYHAFMPTLWRVRPYFSLLLAVSTAVGAVVPARACACATAAKPHSMPMKELAATPLPAAKSCCLSNAAKRACCLRPTPGGTSKAACCEAKATADAPGCHCVRCDCDPADVPPSPVVPAPSAPDFDGHATASPVPVALISEPPTAATRRLCLAPVTPPTDLTISLSRLTC